MRLLPIIVSLIFFLACQNSSDKPVPAKVPQASSQGKKYPPMTGTELKPLWENVDLIDYTFFDIPISMSYDNKGGIQTSLSHISADQANIIPSCKPFARIYYGVQGDHVMEADLFFTPTCRYFIFYKKGKPVFSNEMTPQGVAFLENIVKQVNGQ